MSSRIRGRKIKGASYVIASLVLVITVGVFFLGCTDSNLPQSMGAQSSGETSIVEGYIIYSHIDVVGATGIATIKNAEAGAGRSTGILYGTEPGVPVYPPDTLNPLSRDRYSFFQFEVESGSYSFDVSVNVSIRSPQVTTASEFTLDDGPSDEVIIGANQVVQLPFWKITGE